MFGKRKHSSEETKQHTDSGERQDRAEAGRAPAAGAAERPLPRSAASSAPQASASQASASQASDPQDAPRGRGPSRPDASAVLGRQPTPPVMPETPRRATDFGAARRPTERRQVQGEEGQRLIVGRNISLSGEIKTCEKLVVEGEVDAELTDSRSLEITESGLFKGKAVVDEVEVAGNFEGDMTARKRLYVRASGRLNGHIRFGELEIERGGRIAGTIEELEPEANAPAAQETSDQDTSEKQKTSETSPEATDDAASEKSVVKAETKESEKPQEAAHASAPNGNGAKAHGAPANNGAAKNPDKESGKESGKDSDKDEDGKAAASAGQPNGAQPVESEGRDAPKSTAASG